MRGLFARASGHLAEAVVIALMALIAAGVALIYLPAGLITGGVLGLIAVYDSVRE